MFSSFDLDNVDSHELGWEIGATYKTRAYSNCAATFDLILGYHEGYVVILRKQEGKADRLVQHLTTFTNWSDRRWTKV